MENRNDSLPDMKMDRRSQRLKIIFRVFRD